jgi:hypothetical protein
MEEVYAAEATRLVLVVRRRHPSAHRAIFDRLFRSRLARAYECLGAAVPGITVVEPAPGRGPGRQADLIGAAGHAPRSRYVKPTLDGRRTDFYEWMGAVQHGASGESEPCTVRRPWCGRCALAATGEFYVWIDAIRTWRPMDRDRRRSQVDRRRARFAPVVGSCPGREVAFR